jgi:hypothetical protein
MDVRWGYEMVLERGLALRVDAGRKVLKDMTEDCHDVSIKVSGVNKLDFYVMFVK